MTNLYIALADMGGEVLPSTVAAYLEKKVPSSNFSALEPAPGTKGSADIVGELATLNSLADVATLASALINTYQVYVHPFIAKNPTSALAVRVECANGTSTSLMIDAKSNQDIVIDNLRATSQEITADNIRINKQR